MYLADIDIKKLVEEHEIIEPFSESKLGSAAYDLTIHSVNVPDDKENEHESYELQTGQTVFVSCEELLNMPNNYVGVVIQRNTAIRMGLSVDAPVYQPGHKTRIFLRVTNLSAESITLSKDTPIASIMFEKLSSESEKTYDGRFSNEFSFKGLGNYKQPIMRNLIKK